MGYQMDNLIADVKERVEPEEYRDVLYGGCVSGTVGSLCYYRDTVAFHDKHEDAIWDLIHTEMQSMGETDNMMQFIASWNGSDNVGSMDQFKNLLCWFAVETIVRQLSDALEEET